MKVSKGEHGKDIIEFELRDWRLAAGEELKDIEGAPASRNCRIEISDGEIVILVPDANEPDNDLKGQKIAVELGRTQYDDEPKRDGAIVVVRGYDGGHDIPMNMIIPENGPIEIIDEEYRDEHERLLDEDGNNTNLMP